MLVLLQRKQRGTEEQNRRWKKGKDRRPLIRHWTSSSSAPLPHFFKLRYSLLNLPITQSESQTRPLHTHTLCSCNTEVKPSEQRPPSAPTGAGWLHCKRLATNGLILLASPYARRLCCIRVKTVRNSSTSRTSIHRALFRWPVLATPFSPSFHLCLHPCATSFTSSATPAALHPNALSSSWGRGSSCHDRLLQSC